MALEFLDLYLKAINTIVTLLPHLKGFTGKRRKDYFDNLLNPLFISFQDIHDFYDMLFVDTRERIWPLTNKNELFAPKVQRAVDEIRNDFLDARRKGQVLRWTFRIDAQEDLQKVPWIEERRFLVSIINYFATSRVNDQSLADYQLDTDIELIMSKGGSAALPTPSENLYEDLKESNDPVELMSLLDQYQARLNQNYMNVRRQYRRLQNAIAMKT